jgi:hypothetical protein
VRRLRLETFGPYLTEKVALRLAGAFPNLERLNLVGRTYDEIDQKGVVRQLLASLSHLSHLAVTGLGSRENCTWDPVTEIGHSDTYPPHRIAFPRLVVATQTAVCALRVLRCGGSWGRLPSRAAEWLAQLPHLAVLECQDRYHNEAWYGAVAWHPSLVDLTMARMPAHQKQWPTRPNLLRLTVVREYDLETESAVYLRAYPQLEVYRVLKIRESRTGRMIRPVAAVVYEAFFATVRASPAAQARTLRYIDAAFRLPAWFSRPTIGSDRECVVDVYLGGTQLSDDAIMVRRPRVPPAPTLPCSPALTAAQVESEVGEGPAHGTGLPKPTYTRVRVGVSDRDAPSLRGLLARDCVVAVGEGRRRTAVSLTPHHLSTCIGAACFCRLAQRHWPHTQRDTLSLGELRNAVVPRRQR